MATILIAEDDGDILDLMVFELDVSRYGVATATNGSEALDSVRRLCPDLAVIHLTVPELSGHDVCRALRRDPSTADLPVILHTARAQEGDVESGVSSGADDYVVKPFNPQELLGRIPALLARVQRR